MAGDEEPSIPAPASRRVETGGDGTAVSLERRGETGWSSVKSASQRRWDVIFTSVKKESMKRRVTKLAAHQENVASVTEAVRASTAGAPDDADALARIALTRGFVDGQLRKLAWPKLLGIDANDGGIDDDAYAYAATRPHRDSHVVECDVERSLWAFTMGWSDERREEKRRELRRVINASVCVHDAALPGIVSYYQVRKTINIIPS